MQNKQIYLDHGHGGKSSNNLISQYILPAFGNEILNKLNDSAIIDINNNRLAFSTDSFIVSPIFFPGGNIGELSVYGTVNDLSMCGADPLYLSLSFIIEEGFNFEDLEKIIDYIKKASQKACVKIVTGDTKVMPAKTLDKIIINTSGIGIIKNNVNISCENAKIGDKIILSGSIANHGMALLCARENIENKKIVSDSAPLNKLVSLMMEVSDEIHVMRDPTRGGLGTALNEIALQSNVGIEIWENEIPINKEIQYLCEIMGFDPIYIANEGILIAVVDPNHCDKLLKIMKKHSFGRDAGIIGEIVEKPANMVYMKTSIGGSRIINMLIGEQLPRIC